MKRIIIQTLLAMMIAAVGSAFAAQVDPVKGEKILNRAIHDDCSILAPRVALQHSSVEWKKIFESGKMEAEIDKLCGRKTPIKPFSKKYGKYVFEYMEHYANDSGAIPA